MALNTITYNDKSNYQTSSLADEYKVTDDDMNEIKSVVNDAVTLLDNATSFKTTEVVDGTYLNKPRYRTTFTGTLNGGGSTQTIAHGLSNVKSFVAHTGFATTVSNQSWCIPTFFTDTQYVKMRADTTNIYFNSSTAEFASQPYTLTLWYTKTTD